MGVVSIYFSGSVRGGRSDVDRYGEFIEILRRHGAVLTEHVGEERVEEYEAAADVSDVEIHGQNVAWLRRADVVVAEVTTPSLGVGYEVGRAIERDLPVCCLYRPQSEHDLSAMIRGNAAVEVMEYEEPADIERTLGRFVSQHTD